MTKSKEYQEDILAVPPEVQGKYPKMTVVNNSGYLYAYENGQTHSIAKLVWELNFPDRPLRKKQRIFYIDGNTMNNHHTNLTTKRG